jgi:hypothetical protein
MTPPKDVWLVRTHWRGTRRFTDMTRVIRFFKEVGAGELRHNDLLIAWGRALRGVEPPTQGRGGG